MSAHFTTRSPTLQRAGKCGGELKISSTSRQPKRKFLSLFSLLEGSSPDSISFRGTEVRSPGTDGTFESESGNEYRDCARVHKSGGNVVGALGGLRNSTTVSPIVTRCV